MSTKFWSVTKLQSKRSMQKANFLTTYNYYNGTQKTESFNLL